MGKCRTCGNDSSDWAGSIRETANCPKLSGGRCRYCTWAGNTRVKCCLGRCDGKGNELCTTCGGKGWRYTGNNILCDKPHAPSSGRRRRG
ncbi:hypothetical protein J7T55_011259 [Diaporthe amygdali]|uniref:uncharacterized protein n=1 Tax=Phomopsis amygdali TaxID=1214568 RepID=UPI0022FE584E|nr:uncharacterized protein J7T55_011259 [Diaporthe amygdali]KAJ0108768.1 hypothetical protein J7T55_011259 [Diaporthe amygdali]